MLYQSERHRGRALGTQPVVRTAWGMDELCVIDPDGNLLKFGQESSEQ